MTRYVNAVIDSAESKLPEILKNTKARKQYANKVIKYTEMMQLHKSHRIGDSSTTVLFDVHDGAYFDKKYGKDIEVLTNWV
jgi:hypothetical protein